MLIMVKDGKVIHFTPNMSLPHSEFVSARPGNFQQAPGWERFRSSMARSQRSPLSTFSVISFPHNPMLPVQS